MFDITQKLHELKVFKDMSLPRLISYPRTGSHWFRILMESYLQKPSAVQSFFHRAEEVNSIWCFHIHHRLIDKPHHSEGPVTGLQNAIYLYREPTDTIFSQMKYHNAISPSWDGNPTDKIVDEMKKFKDEYYNHLDFYLNNKSKISNIHYIRYEDLQFNPFETFKKCIDFLGKEWDLQKFHQIYLHCDKRLTKKLTPHDNAVVNIDEITRKQIMDSQRDAFRDLYGNEISETFKDLT
jgi:hypothetical protein